MMMEEEEEAVGCRSRDLSMQVASSFYGTGATACSDLEFIDLLVPVLGTTCHSMHEARDPFARRNHARHMY